MQQPKIININDRKLIGSFIQTSLADNKTRELWQGFKPQVKNIKNKANTDFYSVQVYGNDFGIQPFTPQTVFEKWAAVEVSNFDNIPESLDPFKLSGGDYAVFIYKGTPQEFHKMASYIYGEWIPKSKYQLDNRPHFEIIPEHNKPNDPNAEEEVWIPIRLE